MEEINSQTDVFQDEIGSIAKVLDSKMTAVERMKITKHNLKRISIAIIFYLTTMLIFAVLL
ncbi:MAG: hypothetical protein U9R21_08785 [Candidatus Thermoplasmatota archaeon]|nr:hypothetical protein [Candidatus Thermoplasmatota archaeon]